MKGDEREVSLYQRFLPQLQQFVKSRSVSALLPQFVSTVYSAWSELDKVLIMENIEEQGWREPPEKTSGLDIVHVRLVMSWLARFHAVSHAFFNQYEVNI